jgi:hypothetical protein
VSLRGWFSEGLETSELLEARTLLADLRVESLKRWGKKDRLGQLLVAQTGKIAAVDSKTIMLVLADHASRTLRDRFGGLGLACTRFRWKTIRYGIFLGASECDLVISARPRLRSGWRHSALRAEYAAR